ncbi:excalibur calcium-binding domain-containing protein [Nocardia coubleae]|uniref:excalibur calcium-binding domain-containing protein n=1 Tax=Nocardia coubleae TaxID=356147 RepID=UPI000A4D320A|nr:excalibur calcium-binding domain-containing protein [Nocardia coubleae]
MPPPTVDLPRPEAPSPGVYYKNCKAARAAGAAPIYRGEPGYRPELDANSDGVACE